MINVCCSLISKHCWIGLTDLTADHYHSLLTNGNNRLRPVLFDSLHENGPAATICTLRLTAQESPYRRCSPPYIVLRVFRVFRVFRTNGYSGYSGYSGLRVFRVFRVFRTTGIPGIPDYRYSGYSGYSGLRVFRTNGYSGYSGYSGLRVFRVFRIVIFA